MSTSSELFSVCAINMPIEDERLLQLCDSSWKDFKVNGSSPLHVNQITVSKYQILSSLKCLNSQVHELVLHVPWINSPERQCSDIKTTCLCSKSDISAGEHSFTQFLA